ncbi:MAG: YdeI/OmpD-associated family protein [Xanthomonadaceae bacterium]|nr:YdeI/OmpD-associated family protein [Xanthomonadaceae bacterium]
MKKSIQLITPKSRADFRKWLEKNNEQSESFWVVIYKVTSGKVNLSVSDVVVEALCFGWIDSVPGKIDSEKYKLLVSPRKPTSVWSAVNKKKVKKLIELNLMTSPGLAKIALAKKNGSWTKLNSSDRLEIPEDLVKGFNENKRASKFFQSVAPSSKRAILEWINAAKTDETRTRRVLETVRLAALGIRANHYADFKKTKKKV